MMNKFMKYSGLVALLLVVSVVAAACNSGGGGTSNTPEGATKAFFDAAFGGNADAARTQACASEQDNIQTYVDTVASAFSTSEATVDLGGLTYTKANESGDTAQVTVGGNMSVTVAGQTTEVPFEGATVPLVRESGAWKVCGLG